MNIQNIKMDEVVTAETATRSGVRETAVAEYAELIRNGTKMEPAVVFDVNGTLHLASGTHRRAAYQAAGRTHMPCEVRSGTLWDAVQFGIADNQKHLGERLTVADKAVAVRRVLQMRPELSNAAIAQLCAVSAKTVAKYRNKLVLTREIPESQVRTGRDGRTISTSAIGGRSGRRGGEVDPACSLPPDWEPGRWRTLTPERRGLICLKWWDPFAASVCCLTEVGWDAERIADYLGMRLDEDVRPILKPIPPNRPLAEFAEIWSSAERTMVAYREAVNHSIHFSLEVSCSSAECYAEKDGLDHVATRLRAKQAEHCRLKDGLQRIVQLEPPHHESVDDSVAVNCCVLDDARCALGIDLDAESLERVQQPLKTIFDYYVAILRQKRSGTAGTDDCSSFPST